MDINKFKGLLDIDYSKKQLREIYFDALCDEIVNPELASIKLALHEIVSLGQYSPNTFRELIEILKILPDSSIESIEKGEFVDIYNRYAKIEGKYKWDFKDCNNLLLLLYTDYKNINTIEEFDIVSKSFNYFGSLFYDEEIYNMIHKINYHLSQLLIESGRFFYLRECGFGVRFNFIIDKVVMAFYELFNELQTTFLMHIEKFEFKYSLPCDTILYVFDNPNILKSYFNCESKYLFSRNLLCEYFQLAKEEDKRLDALILKKEINNKY